MGQVQGNKSGFTFYVLRKSKDEVQERSADPLAWLARYALAFSSKRKT
jgi:hypothetical protein